MPRNDMRIALDFVDHRKITRLMRKAGDRSFYCLMKLYSTAGKMYTNGLLKDCDSEDIEDFCSWNGEEGLFIKTLIDTKLLDEVDGFYAIHDWEENQPWIFHAKARSNQAKKAVAVRWEKRLKDDIDTVSNTECNTECNTDYSTNTLESNTPIPIPNPIPNPNPSPTPDPTPDPFPKKGNFKFEISNFVKLYFELYEEQKGLSLPLIETELFDKATKSIDASGILNYGAEGAEAMINSFLLSERKSHRIDNFASGQIIENLILEYQKSIA